MADIIRMARDRVIEQSREAALLFLDYQEHYTGRQWQVRYYSDEGHTKIDTLVAIGIKNGTGRESYRVISYGTRTAIVDVTDVLPDVSEVIHGEIYIVKIEDVWNYVTVKDNTRYIDPITGGPYAYYNLSDGYVWYYVDGYMKREDDFVSSGDIYPKIEEIERTLREHARILNIHTDRLDNQQEELDEHQDWLFDLDNVCFPLTITNSPNPAASTWASGSSHDLKFTFTAKKEQRDGTKKTVTGECKYYYKLSTDTQFIEATNPLQINNVTGENETITYNFRGGDIEKFGKLLDLPSISYRFGYRFLYGKTSGTVTASTVNDLSTSSVTNKSSYYSVSYTTNLNNLATFGLPSNWGTISKITDSSGITDYTTSFSMIPGTFTRTVDGLSVTYIIYRWSSKPTVATNFTYRFYN